VLSRSDLRGANEQPFLSANVPIANVTEGQAARDGSVSVFVLAALLQISVPLQLYIRSEAYGRS
jgi:hypothetical protein